MVLKKWDCSIEGLAGFVEYEPLHFTKRIKMAMDLKLKFDEEGKVIFNDEVDQTTMFLKLYEVVKQQIKNVSIISEEKEIKDFEELGYFAEFNQIVSELINVILKEERLGKPR